jgi:hypothetical protein
MTLRRSTFLLLVAAWCGGLVLAVGCAALRHQHGQPGQRVARPAAAAAPAAARAEAPSAEFRRLGTPDQLAHVHGEIDALKQSLGQEGKYACCVEPWCNQCLLRDGECHCREQVRAEGPCCGECTEAWLDGRGAVEGVDAWELLERAKRARGGPPG